MLKRKAFKKIIISLSCLGILGILYIFPNKNESIKTNISHSNSENNIVYLIDNNKFNVTALPTSFTDTSFINVYYDLLKGRLPENKKIISRDIIRACRIQFRPNYIIMLVTSAIYVGLVYSFGIQNLFFFFDKQLVHHEIIPIYFFRQ